MHDRRVLYQPEWVDRYKITNGVKIDLAEIGILLCGSLLVFLSIIPVFSIIHNSIIFRGMFGLFGVGMILLSITLFIEDFRTMPFIIYHNGITNTTVSLRKGIKREEELILLDQVESIEVTEYFNRQLREKRYVIYFKIQKGLFHKSFNVRDIYDDVNTIEIYRILNELVPDKITINYVNANNE